MQNLNETERKFLTGMNRKISTKKSKEKSGGENQDESAGILG